jgi:hypothetical protein
MPRPGEDDRQLRLRRGRRFGLGLYAAVVVIPVAIWSGQIFEQVWTPQGTPTTSACRAGVRGLIRAVRRARAAAGAELGGERPALERFRTALDPEWRSRPELGQACRSDREGAGALETVDLYRYAEEHALRYEARDVARRRRDIRRLEVRLFGGPVEPPGSGEPAPGFP